MAGESQAVVVLIIHHKPQLEWSEKISLQQCYRILGRHPIRLVYPEGMNLAEHRTIVPELQADRIPARWLSSYRNFNRLKMLPFLYDRYSRFEFILFYELDAFVFRDELPDWCGRGWDYIGAPWFEGYDKASSEAKPTGVGNGGFSLRRTAAMLRVSRTWRYQRPLAEVWKARWRGQGTLIGALADMTVRNNFFHRLNHYSGQEDFFWCHTVAGRFPWFRLAPVEEAKRFSFEANPGRLFRECGNALPFGCHKWTIHEPEFWQRHIESCGYEVRPGKLTAGKG